MSEIAQQRIEQVFNAGLSMSNVSREAPPPEHPASERLDSWKEIAVYLKRGISTVQRWEKHEALPVYRHAHDQRGTVYAYKPELDAWWNSRREHLEKTEKAQQLRARYMWSAGVALVALAAVLAGLNVGGLRDRLLRRGTSPAIQSIAVLPLDNLSGDPEQEYFADGMTEALITHLGQIRALRVISRTSVMQYKEKRTPLPEIAHELNVDAVVEGSVLRSENRVRITANLLHAPTDRHLWAKSYERDLRDVLALQSEVAQAIAREIRITVTPQEQTRLASARPVSPEAHELYLKGRRAWCVARTKGRLRIEGLFRAKDFYHQAIEKDPSYAPAYAVLAGWYTWAAADGHLPYVEASSKAKALALRALEIDDSLAEAHAALAEAVLYLDWDWEAADRESRRAVELNPSSSEARGFRSFYLYLVGRTEESIREAKQAVEVDPLSPVPYWDLAYAYYFGRQYDQALETLRMVQEIDPKWDNRWPRAAALCEKGMYTEGIAVFKNWGQEHHSAWGHMGNAYARAGKRAEAEEEMIRKLKERAQRDGIGTYEVVLVYSGLGDNERAFPWLEKAYNVRDKGMLYLKVDPTLDPLRSDPRFQDLLRRMNFPE